MIHSTCTKFFPSSHLAKARGKTDHVHYYHIRTNEPWCRDHGPIYLTRAEDPRLAIVDWDNPTLAPKERDLLFVGGADLSAGHQLGLQCVEHRALGGWFSSPDADCAALLGELARKNFLLSIKVLSGDKVGADRYPCAERREHKHQNEG